MSMKPITTCVALVAFAAFVLPATASAANSPHLTENGVTVGKGATIVGTGIDALFTTTEGTTTLVTCELAEFAGTLTKDENTIVEAEVPVGSALFYGGGPGVSKHNNLQECDGAFGDAYVTVVASLCVHSNTTMAEDEVQVSAGACGTPNKVKFIIGSTTAGACEYEATGPVKATYKTNVTPASFTTVDTSAGSGVKLIKGGFLCPTSMALAMTFRLETSNGTGLTFS